MISSLNTKIRDPGLGIIPANTGRVQVKLGVCQKGIPNTIYSAGGVNPAKDAIGSGPLLEAGAQVLDVAGGPVLFMPILASSYGTVTGAFTLAGSGTGTVTGSKGPEQVVKVKIGATAGALGTMQFQVAIGSGAYGSLVTSAVNPFTYQVPGQQFTTLNFGNVTYIAGDIYTVNLDGTVTRTGTGPATALNSTTHSPVDAYDIRVLVVLGGALGTATFQYSLDGGNNYSATIGTPSAGVYVIPGTGIVLTFSGTFTAGDLYTGSATAASFGNTDVNNAFTALLANAAKWGIAHVVGTPANAAAAASLASTVEAQMVAAEAAYRYVAAIIECPSSESDATIQAALASFVSVNGRTSICVGDAGLLSRLSGRTDRRNSAWAYTARLASTKLSSHPGQIDRSNGGGALRNVKSLYRDEYATPLLDAARFVTLRTYVELPGYFVTDGETMATPGSDFGTIMNVRVMNRAITVARASIINALNNSIRVKGDDTDSPGTIDERDAQDIEANAAGALKAALYDADEVSQPPQVSVSRTDNILSTSTLNIEISVIPKGYARTINMTIGFKNPALRAAA